MAHTLNFCAKISFQIIPTSSASTDERSTQAALGERIMTTRTVIRLQHIAALSCIQHVAVRGEALRHGTVS